MGNDYGPFLDDSSRNDVNSSPITNNIQEFDQHETNLAILMSQNFDKKRCIDALKKFKHVQQATEYLIMDDDGKCVHGRAVNCESIGNLVNILNIYYKQKQLMDNYKLICKQLKIISQDSQIRYNLVYLCDFCDNMEINDVQFVMNT